MNAEGQEHDGVFDSAFRPDIGPLVDRRMTSQLWQLKVKGVRSTKVRYLTQEDGRANDGSRLLG